MSAILLTYSSRRETSLKEQEKASQPSAGAGVSVQFGAPLRSWIWLQWKKLWRYRDYAQGGGITLSRCTFSHQWGKRVEAMCSWWWRWSPVPSAATAERTEKKLLLHLQQTASLPSSRQSALSFQRVSDVQRRRDFCHCMNAFIIKRRTA